MVVAESHAVRDELIGRIVWRLLIPALFGLPLLGGWVWLATRRGLTPLDAVAKQIATREPSRLQALTPAEAPEEIRPLVESINGLFARVEQTLEAERRFTADAAHELRTPLAALDIQAQVALRAQDAAERTHALEQLQAGADRGARLVNQLLTMARLDPENGLHKQPVLLDRLTEEICATHGAMYSPDSGYCVQGPCRGGRLEAVPVVEGDRIVGIVTRTDLVSALSQRLALIGA